MMATPQFDYSTAPAKVLQFGGGNFLRGFTLWMLQQLNQNTSFEGSAVLVKLTEKGDYQALRKTRGHYHVLLNGMKAGKAVEQHYPINCISQIIHPYHAWEDFLATARQESIRYIVSNSTESGIEFIGGPKPEISVPRSFPGKLTAWLYARYLHFAGAQSSACVILPCELIPDNGQALKTQVAKYANHWGLGEDFLQWIDSQYFCDTLVDRIVSGFAERQAKKLEEKIGYYDHNLVVAEHYHSWVISGPEAAKKDFPFLHPSLGVEWVAELAIYRERKVKVLNGAHTAMVPLGHLLGLETVKEVMEHTALSGFIAQMLHEEVLPTLNMDQAEARRYAEQILDRFRNPFLKHKLLDISLNTITKFRTRLLPSLRDFQVIKQAVPTRLLIAWLGVVLFYRGRFAEREIPLRDNPDHIALLQSAWGKYPDSQSIMGLALMHPVWSDIELDDRSGLAERLAQLLARSEAEGLESLLQ